MLPASVCLGLRDLQIIIQGRVIYVLGISAEGDKEENRLETCPWTHYISILSLASSNSQPAHLFLSGIPETGISEEGRKNSKSPGDPLSFACAPMSHDLSPTHPKASQFSLKVLNILASFPPGGPFGGCGSLSTSFQYNITRRVAL